jgi:xeroderma pigmentosum group C-complementing protein
MIHKKMQSDASRRARLFEAALFKLTQWWHSNFRVIPHKGVRNQTFLEVERQRGLEDKQKVLDRKGKGKASAAKEEPDKLYPWSDRLRSANSLMKHALLWEGSADTSSLLFTALCRALDIPARLVVSLQSVPWTKKSEKVLERSDSSDTDNGAPTPIQRKSTAKAVQVRRSRPKDTKLRVILPRSSSVEPPLEGWPPTVWTELFSRAEGRWIPVDPIRRLIDKKKMFEPPPNCRVNRMIYVVAYEEGESLPA